jgi:hypothetical protein
MKKLIINYRFSLFVLLFYGILINVLWFFISIYLEKMFFDRNLISTSLGYLILMSLIVTISDDSFFSVMSFIKCFIIMIFAIIILIISYFLSWNLGSIVLSNCIVSIIYLFLISNILSKLSFVEINIKFLIWQLLIFLTTFLTSNSLLDGIQTYDYGLQFSFSIWLLYMSIYLFLVKIINTGGWAEQK